MLVGDFNTEITEHYTDTFLNEHELSNLFKNKTYFKNMQNASYIDLLLTNNSYAFHQTTTVLKTIIPKGNPKQITYRDYKKSDSLVV